MDGTLIDRSERITPIFNELAELIQQHEIRFTIASGRCLDQVQIYIDTLGIAEPVIINNGAGARQSGVPLWDIYMNPMAVKKAILKADEMDMAIFMCTGDSETVYRHNAYIQREIDVFGRYNHFYIPLESEWPALKLEKLMITDPEKPGRLDRILPFFSAHSEELTVVQYDARHLDVMAKGVGKEKAVKRLAEHLNIPLSDVMAIGDSDNDLEMLLEVGTGVAVGNAKEHLKEFADFVCEASNTNGVIEAIRRFFVD